MKVCQMRSRLLLINKALAIRLSQIDKRSVDPEQIEVLRAHKNTLMNHAKDWIRVWTEDLKRGANPSTIGRLFNKMCDDLVSVVQEDIDEFESEPVPNRELRIIELERCLSKK